LAWARGGKKKTSERPKSQRNSNQKKKKGRGKRDRLRERGEESLGRKKKGKDFCPIAGEPWRGKGGEKSLKGGRGGLLDCLSDEGGAGA